MRRLSGVLLAGAILLLPAFSQPTFAQAAAPQKFTIAGDRALLMVSVKADKTADYEAVLMQLKDALGKSTAPEAKEQLAGWRIIKTATPQPDGTVVYLHFITPVAGADYAVLPNIYQVVKDPTEQRAIYDKYLATGAKNLTLLFGAVVLDMAK